MFYGWATLLFFCAIVFLFTTVCGLVILCGLGLVFLFMLLDNKNNAKSK
jgi:putative Mn2+ efflux pump MntP